MMIDAALQLLQKYNKIKC